MKYFYSDVTKSLYKSEEELEKAEKEREEKITLEKKKKEELAINRKAAAHEVEEKLKAYNTARKEYNEALTKFCKEYGAFHTSVKADDRDFDSILDSFFGHIF